MRRRRKAARTKAGRTRGGKVMLDGVNRNSSLTWRIAVAWMVGVVAASGHSDPIGEIRPQVDVVGGLFRVIHQEHDQSEEDFQIRRQFFARYFDSSGRLVISKHPVPLQESSPKLSLSCSREDSSRFLLREWVGGGFRQLELQAVPRGAATGQFLVEDASTFRGHEVALSMGEPLPGDAYDVNLHLVVMDLTGAQKTRVKELGRAAAIYDLPVVSEPVWYDQGWWVAWIRPHPEQSSRKMESERRWQAMLTGWRPATGERVDQELEGPADWNTSVSLAEHEGKFCAAWHAEFNKELHFEARVMVRVVAAAKFSP